ncbi:MAG: hypothetical protein K5978_04895, partial [Campylobacter sp.]|nr:hypothetical protein [Campylobacter sp.]
MFRFFSKFRFFILVVFAFLFASCATNQNPQKSKTYQVTILSPLIKINDVGFLHIYNKKQILEIYNSGLNTANIKISEKICVNSACFDKKEFNQKFFLDTHYDGIFSD